MRHRCFLLELVLLLAVAGCGGAPVGTVAGTVSIAGRLLEAGTIVFENGETGISVSANLNSDGSYRLRTAEADGLPPGEYLVSVRPGLIGSGETPLAGSAEESTTEATPRIPAMYHQSATSGLTAEVVEGKNRPFDFELKP